MSAPQDVPVCGRAGCGAATDLVHWQRRLTTAETEAETQLEAGLRAEREYMQDKPLPDFTQYTYLVYACGQHAISLDAAALIHQVACSGPNSAALPACDCLPESPPAIEPMPEQQLPTHWAASTAGGG